MKDYFSEEIPESFRLQDAITFARDLVQVTDKAGGTYTVTERQYKTLARRSRAIAEPEARRRARSIAISELPGEEKYP